MVSLKADLSRRSMLLARSTWTSVSTSTLTSGVGVVDGAVCFLEPADADADADTDVDADDGCSRKIHELLLPHWRCPALNTDLIRYGFFWLALLVQCSQYCSVLSGGANCFSGIDGLIDLIDSKLCSSQHTRNGETFNPKTMLSIVGRQFNYASKLLIPQGYDN